ncbi:radical SAM family heme chaperone HemW [Candidatus Dependentiae bacterium]|nr:radical SAM family heme chaperone HemW [Candidatus Dependentiae bacterium]
MLNSLYLHWPFCPYKCHFCPFVAIASHDQFMPDYQKALKKEILDFAKNFNKESSIKSVFLGGGTPSTCPNNLLLDTFDILNSVFSFEKNAEISIEVNPGTVKPGQLEVWKLAGINRLSIGIQSLNDDVLKKLNRHQTSADVFALIENASKIFENISVDLIIGLPGVTEQEWKDLILKIGSWPIKHLSIYFLTVHEDTPLYFGVKKNKIILPPDNQIIELYYWSINKLKEFGFNQYEISNFAKQGYESTHNSAYWKRLPYKGFGLGACSFDGQSRFQNEKNLMTYMNNLNEGRETTIFAEKLEIHQIWLEKLMLGIRQIKGVEINELIQNLNEEKKIKFLNKINDLQKQNLISFDGDVLKLSHQGLALENQIVLELAIN